MSHKKNSTEAQQHFERALAIREKSQGPDDPETIRDVENLAGLFVRQSQFDNAEPYLKRVLASAEQTT